MKVFFKIVFYLVFAMLLFISLVFLALGKYLYIAILAVFGFLLLSYIRYQSKHYKHPVPPILLKQINSQGFQLLESIYSLKKTKNKDVLIRRIKFINDILYPNLLNHSQKEYYNDIIILSISEYKKLYYNRILTEKEYELLINPNISNMNAMQTEAKKRLKIDITENL